MVFRKKVKLLSRVWLFVTPWTVAYQAPQSVGFSRQEYGVGCHFLLQGIFPTQGSNLGIPHCRQMLYRLSYQGSPNTVFTWVKLRFLNLSTSDILGRIIIFVVGGFPLCCKMFSIILGFTHQIPVGPSFPIWQPKMSPKQFRSFLCGKIALVEYHWIKWIEKKKKWEERPTFWGC